MNKKAVIILSGGMDSTTLLYHMIKALELEPFALSFNYGQRHLRELSKAMLTCHKLGVHHQIVDLSSITKLISNSVLTDPKAKIPEGNYDEESMKATVVPNRNAILLNVAIGYAINIGAGSVYYGAHSGDHAIYPDCRPEFIEAMKVVAGLSNWEPVNLVAPFSSMDKGDILIWGRTLGVDYSLTWTCYAGREKACGKCGACRERLEAFQKAGITDPLEYE
jgi:7-cyano-7-deazaguanine synthase